jgi:hypothetical protein
MVLGPDGADVPQMFIQSLLSALEPSLLTLMLMSLSLLQKANPEVSHGSDQGRHQDNARTRRCWRFHGRRAA